MYERGVEPLDVITLGVQKQDFVADNRNGEEQDGTHGDGQSRRAHPQSAQSSVTYCYKFQEFKFSKV